MQHTTNYNLPQWEAGDRIKRADFNGAMSAIDAALAGAGVRVVAGTYVGDGEETRVISLGFTPKAVLVLCEGNFFISSNGNNRLGGLATVGAPMQYDNTIYVGIVENGFQVAYKSVTSSSYINTNGLNTPFRYLAIG